MAERVLVVEDEPDVLDTLVQGVPPLRGGLAAERDRLA